jgi:hypothetical protein
VGSISVLRIFQPGLAWICKRKAARSYPSAC